MTDSAEATQGVMGGVQASGLRPPSAGIQLTLLSLLPSFSPAHTTEVGPCPSRICRPLGDWQCPVLRKCIHERGLLIFPVPSVSVLWGAKMG